MRYFFATFIKELKLLMADKTGVTVLFVMPVLLVVIMTLIQNEAYKSFSQSSIPVLLVNNDRDSLGNSIERAFSKLSVCKLTTDHGGKYKSEADIKKSMVNGEFLVALVIPENATNVLRSNVGQIMNSLFRTKPDKKEQEQVNIEVIIDPTTSKSFVLAITSQLKEYVSDIKTKVLFSLLSEKIGALTNNNEKVVVPDEDFFVYHENYAVRDSGKVFQPNAVQHNIPAWAIFSIFFIVLPLGGSIINERSEGLYIRMRTLPGSYLTILTGKLCVYFLVALIQFLLILVIGVYILPRFGLPVLDIGTHFFALFILTVALALMAVSYGLLVGTLFDTPQQSAVFGGVSILIMSAIGGIWVPLNIMPEFMRTISSLSPLNWALMGYYELFIRGGGWAEIRMQVLKSGLFFVAALGLSYRLYILKTKLN